MSENIVIRVRGITFGELIEEALQAEGSGAKAACFDRLLWQKVLWHKAAKRNDDIGFVFRRIQECRPKPKIGKSTPALFRYTVMEPRTLQDVFGSTISSFIVEIFRALVGPKNILKTRFEEKPDFSYWDFWVFLRRTIARVLGWDKTLLSENALSAVVISQPEETED